MEMNISLIKIMILSR